MSDTAKESQDTHDESHHYSKGIRSSRLGRLGMLGGLTMGLAGGVVGAAASVGRTSEGVSAELHRRTAQKLREVFGEMKGLPMKLGQMLSYLEDVIPTEHRHIYREILGDLRDRAISMPLEKMKSVIEEDLGAPPEELFARFDPEPIASASIGQVYRAVLKDGRTVAVKVQYPGIRKAIESDLRNASMVLSLFATAFPNVEMESIFESTSERLIEECDYLNEAKNQRVLAEVWATDPDVIVPRVVDEFIGPHVLVTELIEGFTWDEMLERSDQAERNRIGQVLFKFFYRSLYEHGALHADPHPGNYVFTQDGKVAFLDFGCVQCFPPEMVETFRTFYHDVIRGVQGQRLRQQLIDAYGLPEELHEDLWEPVEEYVRLSFEPMLEKQPYRFTRAYTTKLMKFVTDLKMTMSKKALFTRKKVYAERPGVMFLHRLSFGVSSILAGLEAEADWPAVFASEGTTDR